METRAAGGSPKERDLRPPSLLPPLLPHEVHGRHRGRGRRGPTHERTEGDEQDKAEAAVGRNRRRVNVLLAAVRLLQDEETARLSVNCMKASSPLLCASYSATPLAFGSSSNLPQSSITSRREMTPRYGRVFVRCCSRGPPKLPQTEIWPLSLRVKSTSDESPSLLSLSPPPRGSKVEAVPRRGRDGWTGTRQHQDEPVKKNLNNL